MAESRFLQALRERPLLLDAAMGTRLIARGLAHPAENSATWNLRHPKIVAAIHRADIAAGADAVVTNTFLANPQMLHKAGWGASFEAINRRGVELARQAAGPDRFVLGSVAPFEAGRGTLEQVDLLIHLRVDAILLETWEAPQLARVAGRFRQSFPRIPILGSVYRLNDGDLDAIGPMVGDLDAVGMNCLPMSAATEGLRTVTESLEVSPPLIVQPSASLPGSEPDSPEMFARLVPEWLRLGARLLGGCCGTTEAHIAAMRRAIDAERGAA